MKMKRTKKFIAGICAFAVVFGNIAVPAAAALDVSVSAEQIYNSERVDSGSVEINPENFPDENFRAYISEFADTDGDGILSAEEISAATSFNLQYRKITSLKGIEFFTALTYLNFGNSQYETDSDNKITTVDLSKNTALEKLDCGYNSMTSLDVSGNTALTALNCEGNSLTSLDLSSNTALTTMTCSFNKLTKLDVSKNTELGDIYCNDNEITSLDLSSNTKLVYVMCFNNKLTSLNVSKNTEMTHLGCYGNKLTSLDLSRNTKLTDLDCHDNELAELDLGNNTEIDTLRCGNNKLKTLDLGGMPKLWILECGGNELTSVDISKNRDTFIVFKCEGNVYKTAKDGDTFKLSELPAGFDASKASDWTGAEYDSASNSLKNITGDKVTYTYDCGKEKTAEFSIVFEDAGGGEITEGTAVDDKNFPDENFRKFITENIDKDKDGVLSAEEISAVTEIDVSEKNISDLKGIEIFTGLTRLDCIINQLTALDVSKNTALTSLDCSINQLTALDVSKNTALTRLDCYNNQLTALDVSNNTALTWLDCYENQLTALDLSENTALVVFDCSNNTYTAAKPTDGTFSLSELPAGFDVSKASDWSGAEYDADNNSLKNITGDKVTYTYDCGKEKTAEFSIVFEDAGGGEITEGTAVDDKNFPDENFRKFITENIDKDKDGVLSAEEISAVTEIDVSEKNISDLKGIEIFTGLTVLNCSGNKLTSLDVGKNTALTKLDCGGNELVSLDLSKNPALTELKCSDNVYTAVIEGDTFDLSKLPGFDASKVYEWTGAEYDSASNSLKNITSDKVTCSYDCGNGKTVQFTISFERNGEIPADGVAVDEKNFPDENFRAYISENIDKDKDGVLSAEEISAVTEMDVSGKNISDLKGIEIFTGLTRLDCDSNQLTALDVSKNTDLEILSCGDNQLTALDVSKNTALRHLNCGQNQLTALDVSKNTALMIFNCSQNQLTALDVSKNTALEWLACTQNQLTALDVSKNTALELLACYDNQLTALDVSKNTALTEFDCSNNTYTAAKPTDGTFKLSELPAGFDPSKASDWTGAEYDADSNSLKNITGDTVTYTYDCGNNKTAVFTLSFSGGETPEPPSPDKNVIEIGGNITSFAEAFKTIDKADDYTFVITAPVNETKAVKFPDKVENAMIVIRDGGSLTVKSMTSKKDITVKSGTVNVTKSLTANDLTIEENGVIALADKASVTVKEDLKGYGTIKLSAKSKPITLKDGAEGMIKLVPADGVTDKTVFLKKQILKAKNTGAVKSFDASALMPDGGNYGLAPKGAKVTLQECFFESDGIMYADWSAMISILGKKDSDNIVINVLGNTDVKLKFPAKGKYDSITIKGNGSVLTLKGTSVTLTGKTFFENITVKSPKGSWTLKQNGFTADCTGGAILEGVIMK